MTEIDILDTLYGGIAGEFQQEFQLIDDSLLSEVKQCQPHQEPPPPESFKTEVLTNFETIPPEEVFAATLDPEVDVRPRIFDNSTGSWTLVDTGSQVSVLKPSPTDRVNPGLLLEAVNGIRLARTRR